MKHSVTADSAVPIALPLGRRAVVERQLAQISERFSLPRCAGDLIRMSPRDSGSAKGLIHLIQEDPSLVAQVLRRANSDFFGLNHSVHDLATAIRLLGHRDVLNLAITVCLSRMHQPPMDADELNLERLWNHSVAVAAVASLIARVCENVAAADAYLAGLVHDIGLLMLHRLRPQKTLQVVEAAQRRCLTCAAEQEVHEFDHSQLGAFVAREWGLAPRIVDTIRFHHEPAQYAGSHRELAYVVCVANYLCSRAGWPSLGVQNVASPPDCTYSVLELDGIAFQVICDELSPTLEKSAFLT